MQFIWVGQREIYYDKNAILLLELVLSNENRIESLKSNKENRAKQRKMLNAVPEPWYVFLEKNIV